MPVVFRVAVVPRIGEAIALYTTAVVITLAEIALISDEAVWPVTPGVRGPA